MWEDSKHPSTGKRIPLGEISRNGSTLSVMMGNLLAPRETDAIISSPLKSNICLVRTAEMDADTVRRTLGVYGHISMVATEGDYHVVDFTSADSVGRVKHDLSWKAVNHHGTRLVAFSTDGYLEDTPDIEQQLKDNHILDFLKDHTKLVMQCPSPRKNSVLDSAGRTPWESDSNQLLSPHSDIWNSNSNLSMFSPNLNTIAEDTMEHHEGCEDDLKSPEFNPMRHSNGPSDLSSDHSPNVLTSR